MSTATAEDPCRLNRNLSSFAVTDGLCTESMNLHSALLICTVDVDYIDDRTPHIHNYTKIIQTWTVLDVESHLHPYPSDFHGQP